MHFTFDIAFIFDLEGSMANFEITGGLIGEYPKHLVMRNALIGDNMGAHRVDTRG